MNKHRVKKVISLLVLTLVLSACSTTDDKPTAMDDQERHVKEQLVQLETEQQALNEQQAAFQREKGEYNKLQLTKQTTALSTQADPLLPPSSTPGHCFARVFIPPKYENYQVRVLASEASQKIHVLPAKFALEEKRVLVSQASERIEVIPATYRWVSEQVMVKPSSKLMVAIPASYKTKAERILVQPAYTVWKKGRGPIQKIDEATGEIMCLVEVPAQYRGVTTRVLVQSATTRLMEQPAVYKTIKKQVIDKPASTRIVPIPAKYSIVKINKLVNRAQEQRVNIPAKYNQVSKRKLVSDGHMAWREILCETNMTRNRISEIQTSLKLKGFNPGSIDGIIGRNTMSAVNKFQKAKNLTVDQYLNVKTLEALGIKAK